MIYKWHEHKIRNRNFIMKMIQLYFKEIRGELYISAFRSFLNLGTYLKLNNQMRFSTLQQNSWLSLLILIKIHGDLALTLQEYTNQYMTWVFRLSIQIPLFGSYVLDLRHEVTERKIWLYLRKIRWVLIMAWHSNKVLWHCSTNF